MADKTNKIDGVDVSGCEDYKDFIIDGGMSIEDNTQISDVCTSRYDLCNKYPNCCYKQLQRYEQALNEIRDYCNLVINVDETAEYDGRIMAQQILQKAEEVKNVSR